MKRFILIASLLSFYGFCQAQYLAAYEDNLKHLWAFEAGIFTQLEEDAISDFQVGGTLIAYLDGESNFKVYQVGETKTLLEVAPVKYTATDYLLGYSLFDSLYVYNDGEITKLSNDCEEYLIRDSLIVWQTKKEKDLKVFYDGKISTIAKGLDNLRLKKYMAGDNLFAFVNSYTEEFIIFYRGELKVLDAEPYEMKYQAGSDIIAFTDVSDQSFNVFYKGRTTQLDLYKPKSFQVGDQIMSYIDNQDDLQFFEDGEIKYITSEPSFYEVKDHIIVYEEQGAFKTICNGDIYIIEDYIPKPYYLDENTVAYLEHNESIRLFQHCEHIVANKIDVVEFKMIRDVIVYAEENDEVKVFFNGQVFTNEADD